MSHSTKERRREEIVVDVHPEPTESGKKSHRKSDTNNGGKVINDSRPEPQIEVMATTLASVLQSSMEKGFAKMSENLSNVISKSFENVVTVEEETEDDSNLSATEQNDEASAKSAEKIDVDESVKQLLASKSSQKTPEKSSGTVESVLESLRGDLKSEETGPSIDEELAKVITRLVRDGMLEEKLQEKLNKYPRPENCEALTKVRVNQLIWDNLSTTVRSQDLKFQKVQTSLIKGMCALVRVTNAIVKQADKLNGGKEALAEALDSISLLANANSELNIRRKELIKPDLHADYKHLCSSSTPVSTELFGDDISKQVKEMTEVNRVGKKANPQLQ